MNRTRQDAKLTVTTALPAQNTTGNGTSIDLEAVTAANLPEAIQLEVSVPATAALADGQTITVALHDSADNSSFAAIAGLSTLVITGAGGVGAAAASRKVPLPNATRRYVRAVYAMSATTGDNTAVSAKLKILT
jgi:hypothetical protein